MFKSYIAVAIRSILKQPGYTFINLVGLSIGISACVLMAGYLVDESSFDNFHKNKDNIYRIALDRRFPTNDMAKATAPIPMAEAFTNGFEEVEKGTRLFNLFGEVFVQYRPTDGSGAIRAFDEAGVVAADSNFFEFFDFELLEGNRSDALRQPGSVVITEATAQRYFGDDPAIGRSFVMDNLGEFTVSGVLKNLPSNTHLHFDFLISFVSLPIHQSSFWGSYMAYTYLMLAPNTDVALFESKFEPFLKEKMEPQIQQFLGSTYEEYVAKGNVHNYYLQPLESIHLNSNLDDELEANGNVNYLYLLGSVALFFLILACVNFMNLSTARSAGKAREVGVRKALGSSRKLLIGQFMTESILLSLISGILALALVQLLLPGFNNIAAKSLEFGQLLTIQNFVLLILFVVITGVFAGSYPAFYLAQFKPTEVLKGKLATGNKGKGVRSVLVTFQFAISVLLITATLAVNFQMQHMKTRQLGFDQYQLLVLERADLLETQSEAFKKELLSQSSIAGVSHSWGVPGNITDGATFQAIGTTVNDRYLMSTIRADYDFLDTYGIKIGIGRGFNSEMSTDSVSVLINQKAADLYEWEDPIGMELQSINSPVVTVIGVTEDFNFESLHQEIKPVVIFGFDNQSSSPPFATIKVAGSDVASAIESANVAWTRIIPNEPFKYHFIDDAFGEMYRSEERIATMFAAFASLAIAIACLGAFGLSAFMAEQRTKEIGVRKVLGAKIKTIVFLLSKEFIRMVLVAGVLSAPVAYYAIDFWLKNYPIKLEISWLIFVLPVLVLLLVTLLVVSYQTIKAAKVNPVRSLKYE